MTENRSVGGSIPPLGTKPLILLENLAFDLLVIQNWYKGWYNVERLETAKFWSLVLPSGCSGSPTGGDWEDRIPNFPWYNRPTRSPQDASIGQYVGAKTRIQTNRKAKTGSGVSLSVGIDRDIRRHDQNTDPRRCDASLHAVDSRPFRWRPNIDPEKPHAPGIPAWAFAIERLSGQHNIDPRIYFHNPCLRSTPPALV